MDEQPWESITLAPPPISPPFGIPSPAGKGMAASYVDQDSVHDRHYGLTQTLQRDIHRPSLGLDLRFEQTYLRSITPHVHITTPAPDEKCGDLVYPQDQRLDINWGKVIWVTTRDQVLAPMFQGMIWWVSLLPTRVCSFEFDVLASRGTLRPWVQYFRGGSAPLPENGRSSRTGAGILKLKSWLSSIIPPTSTASIRTKYAR